MTTSLRRDPRLLAIALAVGVLIAAATGRTALGWAAAATAAALAWAAVRAHDGPPLLAGQCLPYAIGVALLGICGAGLDQTGATQSWRSVVAVAAYPFLGGALLRVVAAHRRVREADVIVEAALVATAVGIVLHVSMGSWRERALTSSPFGDATGAFPVMVVALDVALLVITVRSLGSPTARRGPLGLIHVGVTALFLAHLWQEIQSTRGASAGAAGTALALVALFALGGAALHPAARTEPDPPLEHPALFSASHAVIVVLALLAAPVLIGVQAVRGIAASPTVATGASISGTILACYLVGLLRERAGTEHQATHDGLTGLPNRTLLVDRLERAIAHARRRGSSCAVLFIDLDRFKEINDTFGHGAGDELLKAVAERLHQCVRDEDTVARLSGDEFVLLLPHLPESDDVLVVAERVLSSLGKPITVVGEPVLLAASIGIASYPEDGTTPEEVLANADAAMYRAKEAPGNTWEVFSGQLATDAQTRLRTEAALLTGIAVGELELHYQPIVDLVSGRTLGAEALVRWNHPEQGLLLPGSFIPIAEQSDLIVVLGEWAILEACRQLRRWSDMGWRGRSISVNVSGRQFSHGLVSTVTSALRSTGADPNDLVIELTESTIVDDIDTVAATLSELREMGVRAAIDDFGTGYCNLRYLSVLPVSSLKIDRSFVQTMTPSGAAIVAATIAMGKSLGLTLVAEGVETPEQRRFLADHGCERAQGFLFGRPMPATEMAKRLLEETPVPPRGIEPPFAPRPEPTTVSGSVLEELVV